MTNRRRDPSAGGGETGQSTRNAILDSAERLFARHGVQGVSVRRILAEANVNVALAHYHFGGRQGLIREVLRRRVEPLNEERLRLLAQVQASASPGQPRLEDTLRAFFAPVVRLLEEHPDFARLAGQLQVTADAELRSYFAVLFGDVLHRFSEVLRDSLPPGLSGPQRVSRAHFILGVLAYLLTNQGDLQVMTQGRFEPPRGEMLLREIVAFCAAGLSAPVSDTAKGRGGRRKSS